MFELDYSGLFSDEDMKLITDLIKSGKVCGWWNNPEGGEHLRLFEYQMKTRIGLKHAKAVSNGTTAIYLALRALGIGPGSVVITAGYNHIGGLAPITNLGATPLFTDVDHYGNISHSSFIDALHALNFMKHHGNLSCGKFAVVITHTLGQPCADTEKIIKTARNYDMAVIEDCSQALGAFIGFKHVGCFGDIACFSTGGDMTKMITCGEGGVIATDIGYIADAVSNLRNHGDKNGVLYPCFNYRMSDIQALIGWITLKKFDDQITRTKVNADYLTRSVKDTWTTLTPPSNTTPSNYILKLHANGHLPDPQITVENIIQEFGPPQPRMAVSTGYKTALTELPICSKFQHPPTPMIRELIETSLWVDYHRWPHTRETMDPLIQALMEL